MDRREALGALVGMGLAAGAQTKSNGMVYRTLGKTGEKVSAIGVGGYHIGGTSDPKVGIQIVRTALDRGINFLDNC
jgi:hypothetical protein